MNPFGFSPIRLESRKALIIYSLEVTELYCLRRAQTSVRLNIHLVDRILARAIAREDQSFTIGRPGGIQVLAEIACQTQ
jgi:hypothetical protein